MDAAVPPVDEERAIIETFTLQVVSPSVGVNGPLSFSQLPTATTIKQLKERIRESLPIRPADENQRLIHRGRLLARETETMAEIFGRDTLKNSESQTLHLVLRPSTTESTARNTAPLPQPHNHPSGLPAIPVQGIRIPQFHPDSTPHRPTGEHSGHDHDHDHVHHHQQHSQSLMQSMQRLHQLQQEGERLHQELFAQQQRMPGFAQPPAPATTFQNVAAQRLQDRAATGMQDTQQPHQNVAPQARGDGNPPIGFNSDIQRPDHTTSYTQEGVGPNGERWQVTVNETTTIFPGTNFLQARPANPRPPIRDIQNIVQTVLRAADANAAQHTRQTTTNPSGSQNTPLNSSSHETPATAQSNQLGLGNIAQNLPAIDGTNGAINNLSSAISDTAPTPATNSRTSSQRSNLAMDTPLNTTITTGVPIVYILSSPTGPRALLINRLGSGIDAYFTPRQLPTLNRSNISPAQNPIQARIDAGHRHPEHRNRREARLHRHIRRQGEGLIANPAPVHPQNPNAGAIAAQFWPHIWLIARLMGFVWFFTSRNSSWWRTIIFSSLALIVFIANTGVLNGIAEQLWGPIRRHLEGLLPLEGPNGPRANALAPLNPEAPNLRQENEALGAPTQVDPDPAQAAARLIERRRLANGNWVWTQFRRVEHATLLFLASLIPGVGERHIAARAAEANIVLEAERQRREAENSATAAVEGGTAAAEVRRTDTTTTVDASSSEATRTQTEGQTSTEHNGVGDERTAENEPLVEV